VVAEYSAAAEELHQLPLPSPDAQGPAGPNAFGLERTAPSHPHLTLSFLIKFLSAFNVDIARLRVMAISVSPYGFDHATQDLMRQQAPLLVNNMQARVRWLDGKNEAARLGKLVEGVCEREGGLMKADYWVDVDASVRFGWSSPFVGRAWMVYRG
jgi:hypothetical protein